MGIYAKEVEEQLNSFKTLDNILHKYDNPTYHIQLFMVDKETLKEYANKVLEFSNTGADYAKITQEIDKILNKKKIIIAESGVTASINIESLQTKIITPVSPKARGGHLVSMKAELFELNASALQNKIALTSYIYGYESYVYQPYFISIWFSGYEHSPNGNPIAKIPLNRHFSEEQPINCLTYSVIFSSIKSDILSNGTRYTIEMVPQFFDIISIGDLNIKDIGQINKQESIEMTMLDLQQKINTCHTNIYGKINPNILALYESTGNYMNITYNSANSMWIDMGRRVNNKKVYNSSVMKEGYTKSTSNGISTDNVKDGNIILYTNMAYQQVGDNSPTYSQTDVRTPFSVNNVFTPDPTDKFVDVIQKIGYMHNLSEKDTTLTIDIYPEFVGEVDNKAYFRYDIKINERIFPGLKDMTDSIGTVNYINDPVQKQLTYLNEMSSAKLLQKRYKWLLNGENVDVIGIKKSDDQLWYLNIGMTALRNAFDAEKRTKESEVKPFQKQLNETVLNLRQKSSNVYIDDIYYAMRDAQENKDFKGWGRIALSDNRIFDKQSEMRENSQSTEDVVDNNDNNVVNTQSYIKSQLGAVNMLQYTGTKMSIDMDIVGDPFWLYFAATGFEFSTYYVPFPHIAVFMKSFYEYDGMNDYQEDPLMELNTLYTIHEITSSFSQGKFTQKLRGFVPIPFIQATKNYDIKTDNNSDISLNQKASVGSE
jgi:hypothetical protein